MNLVFPAPTLTVLPIEGSAQGFAVRRIYCVGRNYTEHIKEMGGDVREPPFFFQKPSDAIVQDGASVPYPTMTRDFQHEVELVLAIGSTAVSVNVEQAQAAVFGFAVGIDLTRRDVQVEARKAGRPWEIGKSFDHSAPCSSIIPLANRALPATGAITLTVNGATRQQGDIAQMIWSPLEVVAKLSEQYELRAGDLIYTGTPSGVGPLARGDQVTAKLGTLCEVSVTIV